MINWSTDEAAFKTPEKKRIWELVQGINYGFDGEKVKKTEVRRLWQQIIPHLLPESRRLWELWLRNRVYSLPTTRNFWTPLPKIVT